MKEKKSINDLMLLFLGACSTCGSKPGEKRPPKLQANYRLKAFSGGATQRVWKSIKRKALSALLSIRCVVPCYMAFCSVINTALHLMIS